MVVMCIIRVEHLQKRFGSIAAVDDVSFDVESGEIFGFLGPNGAGKTTTIRMLTGFLIPDSGDVFIRGVNMRESPIRAKMKMGVIPEMGNVYVDLTAKQNIVLSGRFYGISKGELDRIADDLLERFELSERRDNPVKTFSKGMKQRVNIASAIVHSPEILFLDEPTSGLDVQSQRLIKDIIKEMNQRGTTIFLTTHNIEEANVLCDRVGIINRGKIAAIDTPERLRRAFEETQSVEISFDKPIDGSLIGESGMVSRVEKIGDKWKLYTDNPDRLVKYLAKFAEDQDLAFTSMEICGASLEDVFMKLTEAREDAS
ncbi:Vitamin B12 import ATP-binding protein BtuD [Candidatus Methanoperedenaceae archaeon GB50]|nr:MAG: Vitamin B12 import ATP-binding protein BtuD [Candidatus Methanoperedenaceae archaeon GB50]CAD7776824.1 Vitamin B12 import ATP-binding protein BtuD [Candidatus Methanoperedenaceae archaeon GB50]